MEFHVLGPLEVTAGGRSLSVGGSRTRAVLALLLLNANRVVSADRLMEELWPQLASRQGRRQPPGPALGAAQGASGGRGGRPARRPARPGYVLRVAPDELDVLRFEQLAASGRDALAGGDAATAVRVLDEALSLWRGSALADIDGVSSPARSGRGWRRNASARWSQGWTRCWPAAATGETIAELESLTAHHPLRERFWHQRLLALYRSGRQADALRAFRELRSTLVDQLGIEPGPELRELEARILRQDSTLEYRTRSAPGEMTGATAADALRRKRRRAHRLPSVRRRRA